MTLLVASALGDTPDELYARCRLAARVADIVEVRLDTPSGLPWDLRLFFTLEKPAIATVRVAEEGGKSHADDETRGDILQRALRAGARWIDVEVWHARAGSLVKDAHEAGARAIVSHHDLAGTPSFDDMMDVLRRARKLGADVVKLAVRVEGPADGDALVRVAHQARVEGIPCALMAVNDPFLRLLAPTLGLALAYGSVPDAPAAAPGQVSAPALRDAWRALQPGVSGRTRVAYLLGHPVAHSKSPAMQTAAFRAAGIDACLLALDVAPERLPLAVHALRFSIGANVTTPHKLAIMPLLDEIAPTALEAGAVNVVQVKEAGHLVGHNTDGDGALDALAEARVSIASGTRVLVLGAGGAARAVCAALRRAGADVLVSNRSPRKADALGKPVAWEDVTAMLQRVDVLVNATTVGMKGEDLGLALPPKGLSVLDCVYVPGGTPLVRRALAQGLVAIPGESMLLHQGARAFRLWTGAREAPLDAMRVTLGAPA